MHGRDSDQSRQTRTSPRVGFTSVHAAIDDHTRPAYAEIHPDEKAHRGHPPISRVNNPPGHYT
ncbi:hypothetical protein HF577_36050 [Pseudonocardia xinjiangensis]|uniref:Uncharacterized protein n=1 Tax=Pseudonocardia xinjiangensis TaxID=75289 RepID=A0ABX1RSH2_9PSEU|nr:hypothetical protein [Pseudonocardia xinjiangensis]